MIRSAFWHSFIGHPVMAVLQLFGADRAARWVHDDLFVIPEEGEAANG